MTRYIAEYSLGRTKEPLQIGNVYSIRDWTDARDMVKGIYLMMQQKIPDDYVLGSGVGRTVLDFICEAFKKIDIILSWDDTLGIGKNNKTGEILVKVNEKYKRPLEVNSLIANVEKAKNNLKWEPKFSFHDMISEMIQNDINLLKKNKQ